MRSSSDLQTAGKPVANRKVRAEAGTARKTILEEVAEQGLVGGERDQAVADITRRQNVVVAAQAAGAATIVGDGDDGGEIGQRKRTSCPRRRPT